MEAQSPYETLYSAKN